MLHVHGKATKSHGKAITFLVVAKPSHEAITMLHSRGKAIP